MLNPHSDVPLLPVLRGRKASLFCAALMIKEAHIYHIVQYKFDKGHFVVMIWLVTESVCPTHTHFPYPCFDSKAKQRVFLWTEKIALLFPFAAECAQSRHNWLPLERDNRVDGTEESWVINRQTGTGQGNLSEHLS